MRYNLTTILLPLTLTLSGCAGAPMATAQTTAASPQTTSTTPSPLTRGQRFEAWKQDFIKRASAKGYSLDLLRATILPAKINELALDRDANQPEFTKPPWSYVDGVLSATRVSTGKEKLAQNAALFTQIEARYPVPRQILTAIWGLETSYGGFLGNHDIIDALSTFAFEGRRQAFGEKQLYAILDLLRAGDIRRDQLVGAWAGAMGMTQFIPTTFRDYAVDFDGNGNKDLWHTPADALGSAAHYIARSGWHAGEPVMSEVQVPDEFDYSTTDGTRRSVNDWTVMGVAPVSGRRWSETAGFLEAKLIAPGGARGPKFLTFKNFDVLKRYNNSTSYVMGVSVLADTLLDRPGIQQDWPRDDKPLSFEDKKALQARLTQLGYDTKGVDGNIGPNSRRAIRAWQAAQGLPADGYVEQNLFAKIMGR